MFFCNSCGHKAVCLYSSKFDELSQVLQPNTICCRYYVSIGDINNSIDAEHKTVAVEDDGLTVDEFIKKQQEVEEKEARDKKYKSGVCSVCGKKSDELYTCSKCGNLVCGNCCEIDETFDLDSADINNIDNDSNISKERGVATLVCYNCVEKPVITHSNDLEKEGLL